jgi:hypothetical protein
MKRFITLALSFFLSVTFLHAQKITGIWRGYFVSGIGIGQQQYKYEIQILEASNGALTAVTYSYKTTVFYGKSSAKGIYTSKTKNIILKEDKLLEVKLTDKSEPCLMICYLDYTKAGSLEVLQGTFTSFTLKAKNDCGTGTVYLERVAESEFKKEDFLVKKAPAKPLTNKTPTTTGTTKKQATTIAKPKTNPRVLPKKQDAPNVKITAPPAPSDVDIPEAKTEKNVWIPRVLKERSTELVRRIQTNKNEIKIELYDNGEIDNDTITVYHNNSLVAYRRRLSNTPITIRFNATDEDPIHEFVMVADNLGSIPPNTALMVITAGNKRYEVTLSSNEQKNAKVIVEYRPSDN